jgi:hypothetical protein
MKQTKTGNYEVEVRYFNGDCTPYAVQSSSAAKAIQSESVYLPKGEVACVVAYTRLGNGKLREVVRKDFKNPRRSTTR